MKMTIRRSRNSSPSTQGALAAAPRVAALVGPSGELVVDIPLADQADSDNAGRGHPGDHQEHRPIAEGVGHATGQGRRDDVPTVVERLVAARSPGASPLARPGPSVIAATAGGKIAARPR